MLALAWKTSVFAPSSGHREATPQPCWGPVVEKHLPSCWPCLDKPGRPWPVSVFPADPLLGLRQGSECGGQPAGYMGSPREVLPQRPGISGIQGTRDQNDP